LFSDYVNNFYEQKKNSVGASRFIAKMHLNQLYGIFGRRHDLLETINIYKEDLEIYISSRIIKTIIPINDEIVALLMHKNINDHLIKELNSELDLQLSNYHYLVNANVALASAVTSYARIHMIDFKVDGFCVYSDTDSIFTTNKLDDKYLGKELGYMKDELKGLIIKEAYFLGIKKYGFQYLDESGNLITRSVFAGIQRDYLTFDEIIKLAKDSTLVKEIPLRFYKSLKNLSINIDSTHVSISRSLDKTLINNNYLPLHLNLTFTINNSFLQYLKRKILILLNSIINYFI
jgi:DNA polymerase type B, organellar and viral